MMDKNSMTGTALIIFVRHPELGKVKTRLAKVIGAENALTVYKKLIEHTQQITAPLACKKFVFYAEEVIEHDTWSGGGFIKQKQTGEDLGERMSNAFKELFDQDFQKVLIIGSDCYQLKTEILQQAIDFLSIKEVVIGPTFDGGYYLLGMNCFMPAFFADKNWSTDQVTEQTLEDVNRLGKSYHLLTKLHDVDEAADLELNQISI